MPFKLRAKPVPFEVPAMLHVVAWSARLSNNPANCWLRTCFIEVFQHLLVDCAEQLDLSITHVDGTFTIAK